MRIDRPAIDLCFRSVKERLRGSVALPTVYDEWVAQEREGEPPGEPRSKTALM